MSAEEKVTAIVNPAAGRGRAITIWRRVADQLRRRGWQITTLETATPGQATGLTRSAIDGGAGTILAVGGDGTVHEVANGFLWDGRVRDDARLGIVPAGTGMDFARNLGLRRGVRAALGTLLAGNERRIDVGLALPSGRLFVNFVETGLGANVVAREAEFREGWPGRASFFLAAIGAALDEDNLAVRMTVDGELVYEGPLVSAVVANGRYFGGGMKIAPYASMVDGLFDVLILGDFTRFELLSQIWKVYPGVHIRHRKVLWLTGHEVDIEPLERSRLDLDGELDGPGPYHVSLLPKALRVLV